MNQTRSWVVVVVIALAFAVGWAAWGYHERTLEKVISEAQFLRALDDISDANVGLTLLDKNEPEKAREFFELKLSRGLNEANQLLKSQARLLAECGPSPNLHEAMRRAKAYAENHPRVGKTAPAQAQRLIDATQTQSEKP